MLRLCGHWMQAGQEVTKCQDVMCAACRAPFVPQMCASLTKIGLPTSAHLDNRRLALDVAALLVRWEQQRLAGPPSQPQVSSLVTTSAVRVRVAPHSRPVPASHKRAMVWTCMLGQPEELLLIYHAVLARQWPACHEGPGYWCIVTSLCMAIICH